ncbi:hypothetical protein FRC11_001934 [Ceratobasidium sp. 423]|nr:hypothetical protein FRC11_001934 [Ceratobasidium sp. 423]
MVGTPIDLHIPVTKKLTDQFTKYFGTVYQEMELNGEELRARIDFDTLVRYGRFRLAGDGDHIRTAKSIEINPDARDNSFVRYDLLPDANASYEDLPEVQVRRTHYGQVLDIYYVEFIVDLNDPEDTREPYLLVRVKECVTGGLDATLRENPLVTYRQMESAEMIHIESINAIVGRADLGNRNWVIIDRSRNGSHTQFVDEDGNNFDG